MKTHSAIKTMLIAFFALPLLWSCGEIGTTGVNCVDNPSSPYCNAQFPTQYNFRITNTSPFNESNMVSTSSTIIRVYFSEPVDEATIPGNVLIFAGNLDVTSLFNITVNTNGQMEITLVNPNESLQIDTQYTVNFTPYLLSTVQNPLFGGITGVYPDGSKISFNTGANGSNSKVGPPSIIAMTETNPYNSCGGAIVTFSEDIAYPPQAVVKIKRLLGLTERTVPAHVYQASATRFDQWIVSVPTYECTAIYTQGRAEVQNAADFDGEQLTNPKGIFINIY